MDLQFPKIKRPFPPQTKFQKWQSEPVLILKSSTLENSSTLGPSSGDQSSFAFESVEQQFPFAPIRCDMCPRILRTEAEYQRHYRAIHSHMCRTCRAIFPSAHLLDIHISEQHDTFFQIMAERQSMYRCLLDPKQCAQGPFRTRKERRNHMIQDHAYPVDYPEYFKMDRDFKVLNAARRKRKNGHRKNQSIRDATQRTGNSNSRMDIEEHNEVNIMKK